MNATLSDFFRLYQLPSGRALYALRRSRAATASYPDAGVEPLAQAAFEAATTTRDLELRHRRAREAPRHGPRASALDAQLDRAVSALATIISAHLEVYSTSDPTTDPRAAAARLLDRELFPKGVQALTTMSFVEEHESILRLLARVEPAGDLGAAVTTLGLTPFVARITEVNTSFGEQLGQGADAGGPTWDEIRAARTKQHDAIIRFVAATLGRYYTDDDSAAAARTALLGPILEQHDELARIFSSRRAVRDVDPDTGEVTDEADAIALMT